MRHQPWLARICERLERSYTPRLHMALIVSLTGAIGFLASYLLLQAGLRMAWLRYPSAVAIAYVAFLVLLWSWVKSHANDPLDAVSEPTTVPGLGREAASVLECEELAFVLIGLMVLFGTAWAAASVVWSTPALMAELLIAAGLAAGLYGGMHNIDSAHWMATAVRGTVWRFVVVALLFALAGAAMQFYRPDAHSVGDLLSAIHMPAP